MNDNYFTYSNGIAYEFRRTAFLTAQSTPDRRTQQTQIFSLTGTYLLSAIHDNYGKHLASGDSFAARNKRAST